MNLTELTSSIIAYTENDEPTFVASIPDFIRQAENRVFNTVQHPSMKRRAAISVPSGDSIVSLPEGHLWTYAATVVLPSGEQVYLLPKDPSFIREAYPNPAKRGTPKVYAQYTERELLLGPTTDQVYNVVVEYYGYPTSITESGDGTSWLGDNYEQVLLYGSLIEAYTFMKGENDLLIVYKTRYDEAMSQLKQVGDAKLQYDSYRNGQLRTPVV